MIENAAEIVAGVQAGETWAMEALYSVFAHGVRYMVARSVHDEVDDVLHDAYIATVLAIRGGSIREPHKLAGFMRTIVRHTLGEHIEGLVKSRNHCVELDAMTGGPVIADPRPDPAEELARKRREQMAARTMRELRPEDQELLIRFYSCEQQASQIRAEMRLTPTTYRLRKSRALKRFGEAGKRQLTPKRAA